MAKVRPFAFSATLAATLLAAALPARGANIYAVRRGSFKHLFGEAPSEIAAAFAKLTDKQCQPFEGPAGLKGAVIYGEEGFSIIVYRDGGSRVASVADVGGTLTVQLRDGVKNSPTAFAPVLFSYDMDRHPAPPPAKPRGEPTGVEEDHARAPRPRVQPLVANYADIFSRRTLPAASFAPLPGGWYVKFDFSWLKFYGRLPFVEGKFPVSWRLVADYTAPDGSVSSWGALDDPVILSWARGGDAVVRDVENAIFLSDALGPAYRDRATYFDTRWSTYLTERHIGYIDPGRPTFESKNPDSDDLFYKNRAKPLLDANKNLDNALYFNFLDGKPQPDVMKMEKSFRDEIFSQLDRLIYVAGHFDALRRDYLLARFTDKPVLPPPADQKKAKPKKKPVKGEDDLLDEPDTVGKGMDLDDVKF